MARVLKYTREHRANDNADSIRDGSHQRSSRLCDRESMCIRYNGIDQREYFGEKLEYRID